MRFQFLRELNWRPSYQSTIPNFNLLKRNPMVKLFEKGGQTDRRHPPLANYIINSVGDKKATNVTCNVTSILSLFSNPSLVSAPSPSLPYRLVHSFTTFIFLSFLQSLELILKSIFFWPDSIMAAFFQSPL